MALSKMLNGAFLVLMAGCACYGADDEASTSEAEPAAALADPVEDAAPVPSMAADPEGEHAGQEGRGDHEGDGGDREHREGEEHGGGEHGGEHGMGEESGAYIERGETWDRVRRGAHLILRYEPAGDAFTGTVTNTTEGTLCDVRVEVHLSGHVELGPTERVDVPAGEMVAIRLDAGGNTFDAWTAHPEMSACR